MNGTAASTRDEALIQQIREGNVEAFASLYDAYSKQIYDLSFKFLGNRADAEDMVQEAFIRVYRNLETFRGDSTFFTWLYRITLNLCSNHRKKNARLILMSPEAVEILHHGEKVNSGKSPRVLAEIRDAVRNAMEFLPPHLRRAVFLVAGQSRSHREAAEIEGCSEKTISWRIFRARQSLRESLDRRERR